jgi:hypothetical protein
MAERLYWKMWRTWWTGESHVDATDDELSIGPCLMSFIRWEPGDDYGWAVNEKGRPVTTGAIARRARWDSERTARALSGLVDHGTIELRSDGAWGFPKWGPWQESADAARKRKKGRADSAESPRNVRADSAAIVEVEVDVEDDLCIEPFGLSPENPPSADVPGMTEGAQILTHPTAGEAGGRVATLRRRAAVELWDWHEGERIRRLLSGQHKPRKGTDKSLGPVLRLHAYVRKAYDCDEAEAWARIRAYREARLEETERALREGHPQADKWRGYAAGEAAWSHKGFDYLEQRGADPRAAKAASDAEFQALVAARKRGES